MNGKTVTDVPGAPGPTAPGSESNQERLTPAPVSNASKDFSGTTLGGYRLVRKIAEGGMGTVYEAIQLNLSRKVALKILTEELASRPEFLQRFEREAKAAAALNHPNVVQVHDFGQTQGWHYLIMEYVEGEDLSDYAEQHGKLSIVAALDTIEQAAQALKAACEKSIVHRDVKPSNLLLMRDGRVKVLDLGLAKILTEASELTLSGIGMGSPYFMAPEQASNARGVDHRADIYALGLTLLFLLTGKRPFDGDTPFSIVLAHANKPLPRGTELGTELPGEVEALIQRMSAKDPAKRYANYELLIDDLRRVKAGYAPAFKLRGSKGKLAVSKMAWAALAIVSMVIAAIAVSWSRNQKAAAAKQSAGPPAQITQRAEMFAEREPNDRFRRPPEDDGSPPDAEFGNPQGPEPRNRGEGRFPFPLPRLSRPNFSPLSDGPLETMLAQADDYAAKNSQNFREIIDRYRQISSKARGSAQEPVVDGKLDNIISQHQQLLRKTLSTYEGKMNEKVQAHKLQEAYDVWKDFPNNLRTRESDLQIQQTLERALPAGFRPQPGPTESSRN